ncbi:MAG: TonB-dependent receptor, partial [Thiopseudomonas sp.]
TELGLRHDKNQQYGSENTWNGAVTVPVNDDNSLTLSYSEGFRTPTFNDLYWPGFSNPNLKPEKSVSYELQLRSRLTDVVSLEASAFQTKVRDQIRYQGNTNLKNVQTSVLHQFDTVTTSLTLSILDPRDRKTGQVLTRVAKRTLTYDVDKQLGDWSLGASWQLHSHATDAVFNNATWQTERKKIAGHGVVDLRASWQATSELAFGLRLGNIFDQKYSRALYDYQGETSNYREDRANIQASVTWTPKLF